MKVLKFLLYIILGLAALVVALGIFGKKAYHLERTVTIKAPLSTVHEMVSHWSHFPAWSPWQQLDPNVVTKIDGKDGTAGAKFSWVGNKNAGEGSMTFTEVAQNKVAFDIAFVKPWKTAAPSAIAMQETPEGVQTTWAFDMHIPFPFNGFALFTDIDRGVGKDFADGLQRLKSLCETETRKLDNALSAITVVPVPNQTWLGFRKKIPMSEWRHLPPRASVSSTAASLLLISLVQLPACILSGTKLIKSLIWPSWCLLLKVLSYLY
jgi:uncharacterized protein YndB with AHSA1/START domain